MNTLEEVLGSIESDDVKNAVVNLINAEKERGIEASRKKDKENLSLKGKLKETGWDSEKYETWDDFVESKKSVEKKATESNLTIAQLNDKVNELTDTINTERENTRKATQKAKENKLTAELTGVIKGKFYGDDYLIKDLIREGRADITDNGITLDGLPLSEGVEKLKEENPDMVRVNQKGGTGLNGGETPEIKEKSFAEQLKEQMKK